jgi:transcriptional regulator with XRE-family HTH domain
MPVTALTGSRVREKRLALGLKQADLARAAGVSASYLNLIEHNRRKIGPEVLARLARALGIESGALAEGTGAALLHDLRAAAAGGGGEAAELDRAEEFAGRYPGWAGLVAAQHDRLGRLERALAALNDRMTHDPHLGQALHEVLSAVSSIRSTAEILAETEDIAPDWRARFHRNLHADSERLALGSEALVAYLDVADQAEEQGIAAPQEEIEAWLAARGWQLPELEGGGGLEGGGPEGGGLAAVLAEAEDLASVAARRMARDWVARTAAEVARLPLRDFRQAWAAGDPLLLAGAFGVGVAAVLRRAALMPGSVAGLVVCDASGTLLFRKPTEGFALPRFGSACPLWPLYVALARPMTPVQAVVEMAGQTPRRFRVRAYGELRFPQGFAGPEVREAAMLIEPLAGLPEGPVLPVGTSCRICPRAACAARREPSILGEAV